MIQEKSKPRKKPEKDLKYYLGRLILWVVFFPIMVGFKVITSKKLDTESKVFIIILLIGAVIYFMSGGSLWS